MSHHLAFWLLNNGDRTMPSQTSQNASVGKQSVSIDLASPTAGQPLISALIGGAQPINGCGPLSRSAILKERVEAKGTITKVHRRPPKPTYRPSPIRSGRRCKRREAPRRLHRRPRLRRRRPRPLRPARPSTSAWLTTPRPAPPSPAMVCSSTSLSVYF